MRVVMCMRVVLRCVSCVCVSLLCVTTWPMSLVYVNVLYTAPRPSTPVSGEVAGFALPSPAPTYWDSCQTFIYLYTYI